MAESALLFKSLICASSRAVARAFLYLVASSRLAVSAGFGGVLPGFPGFAFLAVFFGASAGAGGVSAPGAPGSGFGAGGSVPGFGGSSAGLGFGVSATGVVSSGCGAGRGFGRTFGFGFTTGCGVGAGVGVGFGPKMRPKTPRLGAGVGAGATIFGLGAPSVFFEAAGCCAETGMAAMRTETTSDRRIGDIGKVPRNVLLGIRLSSLTSLNTETSSLRCWAEVDLPAIRQNAAALHGLSPGTGLMAIVKANAYGHGLTPVARALAGHVEMFGVANLSEARECVHAAPGTSVFLLGAALPAEREAVVREGFIPAVSSVEEAAAYGALASGKKVGVHLAIDTGMGRMGVWQDEALTTARAIAALPGVELAGVCSHLPSADSDDDFTGEQLGRFQSFVAALRTTGLAVPVTHVENSAGLIRFPGRGGSFARTGLALYGVSPRPEFQSRLRPALVWKTRVLMVREFGPGRGVSYGRTFITPTAMRVATLAAGYADGYPRQVSGKGAAVLIEGRRCPVLGRVTMDQMMVDVSGVANVQASDEAVLLGSQGAEEIPATEIAQWAGTIAWDIFTGIGQRVLRRYPAP
jgi:alanine racemase